MSWQNKANEEIVISYHNYLKLSIPARQCWTDSKEAPTYAVRIIAEEVCVLPIADALEHDKAFS